MANQLTLELEPALTERFSTLRECMTACVYQRGLKRVAADLDKAPGNLSRMLAGDSGHHFSVECMERYIQTQGDLTPILYLVARYMADQAQAEAATLKRVETLLSEVSGLMAQTQMAATTKKPRR